jgi:hypothetical protein
MDGKSLSTRQSQRLTVATEEAEAALVAAVEEEEEEVVMAATAVEAVEVVAAETATDSRYCSKSLYATAGKQLFLNLLLTNRAARQISHSAKQGVNDMGDKGKRDKGKKEQQKKALLSPKEKRKVKREKKNKPL